MAGQPKAHWKTVAESYVCETCGAGPGDPCLTVAGNVSALPHVTRTRLAASHGWLAAEEVDGFDSDEQV